MFSILFSPFSFNIFQNVKINHHKIADISRCFSVMLHHGFWAASPVFFLFNITPPPFLYSDSVFSPPPLQYCWVLSPCYVLFTRIKTLSFTSKRPAWVSLTHLTMVTVQSPGYILPCTHRPPSFQSCEGHRWRKEGWAEDRYQINPLGPASRLRHIETEGHKGTSHYYNLYSNMRRQCQCF